MHTSESAKRGTGSDAGRARRRQKEGLDASAPKSKLLDKYKIGSVDSSVGPLDVLVVPRDPAEAEAFWAELERESPGLRARLEARNNSKKPGLTPEQRWQLAIEAGVEILLDYLRREGKRLA